VVRQSPGERAGVRAVVQLKYLLLGSWVQCALIISGRSLLGGPQMREAHIFHWATNSWRAWKAIGRGERGRSIQYHFYNKAGVRADFILTCPVHISPKPARSSAAVRAISFPRATGYGMQSGCISRISKV